MTPQEIIDGAVNNICTLFPGMTSSKRETVGIIVQLACAEAERHQMIQARKDVEALLAGVVSK